MEINPFSPAFQDDPYPVYHELRRRDPVHRLEVAGIAIWVLSRYDDVVAALRDPRLSSEAIPRDLLPRELADGMMFYKDPPDHTRLRGLFARAFTPAAIERLRPRIQARVDALIGGDRLDLIEELALPISLTTIAEILGVPVEDRTLLARWSDELAAFVDGTRLLAGAERARRAAAELTDYLREVVRRRAGGDDLISALAAARDGEDRLSHDELIACAMFVLIAGHETTTHLIGNGLHALLHAPDERARFAQDPAAAVEELLRFDGPVQLTTRLAKEPLEIRGRAIARGEPVCVLLGAANRDPEQFADPDRLDLGRRAGRQVAMGHGLHYCLGAALARLEGEIAIGTLLARAPKLALDGAPVRRPGVVLRGFAHLPVTL
jgi:cytochrome P450